MHSLAFTLEDFQLNEIIHHLRNHIMKIMPIYIKNFHKFENHNSSVVTSSPVNKI